MQASGGPLTLTIATIQAYTDATGRSLTDDVIVQSASNVSGRSSVTLTAAHALSVLNSGVASDGGSVSLTANGGALTLTTATVSAHTDVTGHASADILIQTASNVAGTRAVSLTADGAITITDSSVSLRRLGDDARQRRRHSPSIRPPSRRTPTTRGHGVRAS